MKDERDNSFLAIKRNIQNSKNIASHFSSSVEKVKFKERTLLKSILLLKYIRKTLEDIWRKDEISILSTEMKRKC